MVQPPGLRCYATLNVSPYADSKALVSAYRRLALQTHPDKNNNTVEANEKFKEQLSHTFEYLNDDTRRKEYDRIVATAYAQLNRELAEYYKELHDVRQKIRQSETLHMNSGTNAGWHNGMPTSDMDKESQLLKRIDLKYQELVPLNGEIRQIPANPGKTLPTDHLGSGLDFWRASSQCQEKRAERLQQQVTNQQKALGIKETEIMGLKTQNERLREKVYKLSRENDCQKKLVREKTAVVDALKERSKNVREEKDQLLELNRRFKEDIDALKEERDRQQAEFKKLKEKVTRLEVERDTARNIQKVREEQQQSQGKMDGAVGHKDHRLQDENHRLGLGNRELKKDIREWEKVEREEVEREEVKRELERETDKKATATSNTRYGTLPSRSNTKRSKSGKRYRSSEEPEDSTTLEGGDISSTTKRPRAGKWSDPDDLFTPSLNIPSSEVPSGGLVSVNNGSVAAGSVAIVRKETSPEPR